jgi:hypothetical protein
MRRLPFELLLFPMGVLVGWLASDAYRVPTSGTSPPGVADEPAAVPGTRPVVCLHVERPQPGHAPPTADELRLRWCDASLGTARKRIDLGRLPWPKADLGPGDPDNFDDAVEQALLGCHAKVLATDCTEYPCMAVLGPDNATQAKLDCEPRLQELYGDGATINVVPTRCPDGRLVRVPVVSVGDPEVFESQVASLMDSDEPNRWSAAIDIGFRIASRRFDDALALADVCAAPQTTPSP